MCSRAPGGGELVADSHPSLIRATKGVLVPGAEIRAGLDREPPWFLCRKVLYKTADGFVAYSRSPTPSAYTHDPRAYDPDDD